MTKIVKFEKNGGPEVLKIETVNLGKPGPEEVQIEQKAIDAMCFTVQDAILCHRTIVSIAKAISNRRSSSWQQVRPTDDSRPPGHVKSIRTEANLYEQSGRQTTPGHRGRAERDSMEGFNGKL